MPVSRSSLPFYFCEDEVFVVRTIWYLVVALSVAFGPLGQASAQDAPMSGMDMEEQKSSSQFPPQAGSGTSWEPSSVPEHEWMLMPGGWELMAHGVIFT